MTLASHWNELPKEILADLGLSEWSILVAYRGSIAHGMYTPPASQPGNGVGLDDIDVMGVCVPPLDFYTGLSTYGSRGTKETRCDEYDAVCYEARKFITLLAQGNPNVLSMLWLEPRFYLRVTPNAHPLLSHKHLFSTRHVFHSFSGYARGQSTRMTRGVFKGYQNEKRKALYRQFGFDCKAAAHLIRLLRMGIEFLRTGEMIVFRPDAEELLEIKRGERSHEWVTQEAARLFSELELAHAESNLPEDVNWEKVNRLAVDVVGVPHYVR